MHFKHPLVLAVNHMAARTFKEEKNISLSFRLLVLSCSRVLISRSYENRSKAFLPLAPRKFDGTFDQRLMSPQCLHL